MLIFLRQSTAGQEVPLGTFLDDTDGKTPETGLSIANTDIKIWKTGGTSESNKNSGGATHIASGRYYCVLDATDTDTLGPLEINVLMSGALPVRVSCCVLSATIYDDLFSTGTSITAKLANGVTHGGSTAVFQLERLIVTATTTNASAVTLTGNGTGAGLSATGGASGPGGRMSGGATSGNGLSISGYNAVGLYVDSTNADGVYINGAFHGLKIVGNGINGVDISATSGIGVNIAAAGTAKEGLKITGAAAVGANAGGHAVSLVGGAATTTSGGTAGRALNLVGGAGAASTNVSGIGFYAAAGANGGAGGNDAVCWVGVGAGFALNAATGGVSAAITGNITGNLSGSVGSVTGGVNVTQFGGTNGTFAGGRAEVNLSHIAGSAVNTSSAQLGVNVVNAAGTAWGSGAITAASIADGAIDRATFAADTGLQTIRSGTATAGAAGTITLDGSASTTANAYTPCLVYLTGGTGAGQVRLGTAYSVGRVVTVVPNWTTNPDATTTFALLPAPGAANLTHIAGAAVATGSAQLGVNVVNWGGTAIASANVRSNVIQWNSSNVATPATAGHPVVTMKVGTGTGEINVASGVVPANVTQFGGSAGTFSGGRAEVNLSHIAGSAVNTSSAQLGVNIVNAGGTAWASGAITASVLASGAIDRDTLAADTGLQTIRSGTAQAGGAGTITLDAGASAVNGYYYGQRLLITGGTGVGQSRAITGYTGSTKVATTTPGWDTTPDATSTFAILPDSMATANVLQWRSQDAPTDNDGRPAVAVSHWYDPGEDANAPVVFNGTTYPAVNMVAIDDNPLSTASNSLAAAFLSFFDVATPSLTMNYLKTTIDTIATDTADTNTLANGLDGTLFDGSLAAVKAVTAKLDTALELDGGVYRFTTNALEQAPTGGGGGPTAADIADEVQTRTLSANLVQINSSSITTGSGANMAAAFLTFFDVATPSLTAESINQTGDSFVRIGTNGAGLTALPWNPDWDAEVQSEAEDALNALGFTTTVSGRIDAAVSSRATNSGVWTVGGRTLTSASNITTSGQAITLVNKHVVTSDTLNSTTVDTVTDASIFTLLGGSSTTDVYVGDLVVVRRSAEWEDAAVGVCSAYNGTTKQVTLLSNLSFTPANGDLVAIVPAQALNTARLAVSATGVVEANLVEIGDTADFISNLNGFLEEGLINGSHLDVNVVRMLGTDLASANNVGTAFKSFFDVATPAMTVASVNQTGDSFARIGSTGSGLTSLAPASTALSTAVWTGTIAGRIDAAVSSRSTLTEANVRTAVGLATANLDTQLATIDTNVDAVLADTFELQSDWTVGGRLDTLLVDTKVVTDKLDTAFELDGSVYRLTANALEQAPTGGSAPTVSEIADEIETRTLAVNVAEWASEAVQVDVNNKPMVSVAWFAAASGMTAVELQLTTVGADKFPKVDITSVRGSDTAADSLASLAADYDAGTFDANVATWAGYPVNVDAANHPLVSVGWWNDISRNLATQLVLSEVSTGVYRPAADAEGLAGSATSATNLATAANDYGVTGFSANVTNINGDTLGGNLNNMAMAFKSLFDVATPTLTLNSLQTAVENTDTLVTAWDAPLEDVFTVAERFVTMLTADGPNWKWTPGSLQEAPTGGSAPTAVEIRQEIDTNSTKLTAIKAKTDLLVAAPTNWSSLAITAGGVVSSNAVQVSGSAATADNLEAMVTGGSGVSLSLQSIAVNNPSGHGIEVFGLGGYGVVLQGISAGLCLEGASGSNAPGLRIQGDGTAAGDVYLGLADASLLSAIEAALATSHGSGQWDAVGSLTAAAVRTEMDSNSTQLAAIKAKTDLVTAAPTNWSSLAISGAGNVSADVKLWRAATPGNLDSNGFVPANVAAINGNLTRAATFATQLDSDVLGGVATVTTRLNTMLELDGSVYRLTSNALEQSPAASAPTAVEIRQEIDSNSVKLDVAVSSRLASAAYTTPPTASAVATASAIATTAALASSFTAIDTAATANKEEILTAVSLISAAGDGSVAVDHNFGGTDAWRVMSDPPDSYPLSGVSLTFYRTSDYTAGNRTSAYIVARARSGSDGRWTYPVMLDPGEYTVVFSKNGAVMSETNTLTVE